MDIRLAEARARRLNDADIDAELAAWQTEGNASSSLSTRFASPFSITQKSSHADLGRSLRPTRQDLDQRPMARTPPT
jgi:hypothetical protein